MARTTKSSKKRNARTTDLSVNRKKAGNVKGGWPMAGGAAAAAAISRAKERVDDDQSMVQFEIQ